MNVSGFSLFDTEIGCCGIAWTDRGVVGVQLPTRSEAGTRARLARRFPSAVEAPPTPAVQTAIDGIVALLAGEARDLEDVELDLGDVPEFDASVYRVARSIPPARH